MEMLYILAMLLVPAVSLAATCETTQTGKPCAAWEVNDFGLDPASKRCAIVDGLKRPWCFVGSGDADWDYCEDDCGQQDPTPAASAACSITVTGKPCDAWGENDFGLDPASATCEQVDGLDRPWCYTNEEDWDYCNCDRQGARTASAAADQAGAEPVRAKRAVEPGCDDDRAETLALRRQIVELKDNKRDLEMRIVELRKKLSDLGHEW